MAKIAWAPSIASGKFERPRRSEADRARDQVVSEWRVTAGRGESLK
jgi:hypothetical protein